MIRKMLQAILCIILCPLLVSQQISQPANQHASNQSASNAAIASAPSSPDSITLAKDTPIELVSLDPIDSATAKAGDKIRFRLIRNVIVQNVTVIPAGTLFAGTIMKAVAGEKHHRDGLVKLRIDPYRLGPGQAIRLTGQSWADRDRNRKDRKAAIDGTAFMILTFPSSLIFRSALDAGGGKPIGNELRLPQCFWINAYSASEVQIPFVNLSRTNALPVDKSPSVCPSVNGRSVSYDYRLQVQ
jgi:hypothetical protein